MKKKFYIYLFLCVLVLVGSIFLFKPIFKGINFGLDLKGGFEVLYLVEPLEENEKLTDSMLNSTYKSIINRIDTLGVSEPEISIEGDKIRVKLPGVKDEDAARERLSTPAVLSFRDTSDNLLMTASVLGSTAASLDYDEYRNPVVALSIKDNDTFYKVTKSISKSDDQTIVIWLDFNEEINTYENEKDLCGTGESNCISSARVQEAFSGNVVIKGSFTKEEASNLVDLINSGSLPTKLTEISTNTVNASFGQNTLNNTFIALFIAIIFISILMIVFYRFSGFISSICLVIYSLLVFIIFNLIDGVLTLPGIAALILGIGMAIDASIITLERIKESLSKKKDINKAFNEGSKSSLSSLIDSNITTLLAALILFMLGESSVKGFATMLILTIIVTIITMIILNRFVLKQFIDTNYFKDKIIVFIGKVKEKKNKDYNKFSFRFILLSILIFIIGFIFLFVNKINFGIDFTGGTNINVTSTEKIDEYLINKALENKTIIEEKSSDKGLDIKVKETLNNEEMKSIKNTLIEKGYDVEISVISNVVKKDLSKNAVKALLFAIIGILIYIAFRFTMSYASASIVSLLFNILFVCSMFLIFKIEVNFLFVAATLTIIGYSINDTIVIFDTIRSTINVRKKEIKTKEDLNEIVNESIKKVFKRNILTSITTISTIIILLIQNTSGIYEFNLAVLFGLTFGTFSSLFVATYVWKKVEFKNLNKPKEEKEEEKEIEELSIKGINS